MISAFPFTKSKTPVRKTNPWKMAFKHQLSRSSFFGTHVSKILVGGGFAFGCRKNRRTDYFHDQRKNYRTLFPANDQNQCYLRIYNIVAVNALGGEAKRRRYQRPNTSQKPWRLRNLKHGLSMFAIKLVKLNDSFHSQNDSYTCHVSIDDDQTKKQVNCWKNAVLGTWHRQFVVNRRNR